MISRFTLLPLRGEGARRADEGRAAKQHGAARGETALVAQGSPHPAFGHLLPNMVWEKGVGAFA